MSFLYILIAILILGVLIIVQRAGALYSRQTAEIPDNGIWHRLWAQAFFLGQEGD